jgi:hypothetical protein
MIDVNAVAKIALYHYYYYYYYYYSLPLLTAPSLADASVLLTAAT